MAKAQRPDYVPPNPEERATEHGQASGQRPEVTEQPNDPTQSPRTGGGPKGRAGEGSTAKRDEDSPRDDNES